MRLAEARDALTKGIREHLPADLAERLLADTASIERCAEMAQVDYDRYGPGGTLAGMAADPRAGEWLCHMFRSCNCRTQDCGHRD
jgi:hypothetical protein